MVIPTTARPSRTSIAATVELSTPPLMATAMGDSEMPGSSMNADPAQMRHARPNGVDQCVYLLHRIAAPQRKAHTGARALIGEPNRFQNVRWRQRAARTRRPRRHREAPQIERDHHRFAIDAVEIEIARIGHAIPTRAIHPAARDAIEHRVFQTVAQRSEEHTSE